jgi:hypothetical protein
MLLSPSGRGGKRAIMVCRGARETRAFIVYIFNSENNRDQQFLLTKLKNAPKLNLSDKKLGDPFSALKRYGRDLGSLFRQ